MMTTTAEPDARPIPAPGPAPDRSAVPNRPAASTDPAAAPGADTAAPASRSTAPTAGNNAPADAESHGVRRALAVVAIIGAIVIGAIGFGLSFQTLSHAGTTRWGFGQEGGQWFAFGIDAGIVTCLALDLLMTWLRSPFVLLRVAAHGLTLATIWFNASAQGPIGENPVRAAAHAIMPGLFILGVEAGRRRLRVLGRIGEYGGDPIPMSRWLLAPWPTWCLWRRMQLWEITSYRTAVELEKSRKIYGVWIKHREELEAAERAGDTGAARRVGVLDRLPELMRPYGLSVDEALALPARMRQEEQDRRHREEQARRLLELDAERKEAAAEQERIRIRAEIERTRREIETEAAVGTAHAEADGEAARAEAAGRIAAARRAAIREERQEAAEAAVEETARLAEARSRAAEATRRALEAEKQNTAEAARQAAEKRRAKEDAAAAAEAHQRAAEADQRAAEAKLRTVEARQRAAEMELRVVEAEEEADLRPTERTARKVARWALAETGGDVTALELTMLAERLRCSESTASLRRAEAAQLLADGYRPRELTVNG